MKLACPQCRTSYELNPAALGSTGRQVRCSRCQAMWFAPSPMPVGQDGADFVSEMAATPALGGFSSPPTFTRIPSDDAPIGSVVVADDSAPADERDPTQLAAAQATEPASAVPGALSDAPDQSMTSAPDAAVDDRGAPAMPRPRAEAAALVAQPAADAAVIDIESLAERRCGRGKSARKRGGRRWRVSRIAVAIAALAALDAGLLIWRDTVVKVLPQTASLFAEIGLPVNLRQLAFQDIHASYEEHEGAPILVLTGDIVATGKKTVDVPRLRFSIQADNGREIYAWTALPTRSRLAPGEKLPFHTRLASPPEQGRSVQVRFFNRLDLASGLH